MARAVRKVSRLNTKNQKKETKLSKRWLTAIITLIVVILAGVAVGLGFYFSNTNEEYISDKIYFAEETSTTSGQTVTFEKENYQAIKRYINEGNISEYTFIFVYDGSSFYADEKDEDNYNKEYANLIKRIADLQYEINEAKAADISIELYIVDINVDSGANAGILSDSSFGALNSGETSSHEPAFIFLQGGEFKETVEIDGVKHTISTGTRTEIYSSSITYAINYINTLN